MRRLPNMLIWLGALGLLGQACQQKKPAGTTGILSVTSVDIGGDLAPAEVVDEEPPVVDLDGSSAVTRVGFLAGIRLNLGIPEDTTGLDYLDIRRIEGATAPVSCAAGALAYRMEDFSSAFVDDTAPTPGQAYSYRICAYDSYGELLDDEEVLNVVAYGQQHTIFVSSESYTGDLKAPLEAEQRFATSLDGADYRCQSLADAAGLGGRFVALLSVDHIAAKDRVALIGPVLNQAGATVFADPADAWGSGNKGAAILDETGGTQAGDIWSSDAAGNLSAAAPNDHCDSWRSASASVTGLVASNADAKLMTTPSTASCDTARRLLCINVMESSTPALKAYASGLTTARSDFEVSFPQSVEHFARAEIRVTTGLLPPHTACAEGTDTVLPISGSLILPRKAITLTNTFSGGRESEFLSARLCVFNGADELVHSSATVRGFWTKGALMPRVLFATSEVYNGNLARPHFGQDYTWGLGGADGRCNNLVNQTGLKIGYILAHLAANGSEIPDRFPEILARVVNTRYQDMTATPDPQTPSLALWSAASTPLLATPAYDESGYPLLQATQVWTGAGADGTPVADVNAACASWTDGTATKSSRYGLPTATNGTWLDDAPSTDTCDQEKALYCLSTLQGL